MEENENRFEIISGNNYQTSYKKSSGFGKTILLPFFSGIAGCALMIGTCFGVPSIKEKIIGDSTVKTTVQASTPTGTTTNFVSLSNYSNTAVFAANKILPSIVGIQVTYTTTSTSIFGFGIPTTSEATATGSGIIISENGYIVTNNHVIDTSSSSSSYSYYDISDATSVKIKLHGSDELYDAEIVGKDSQTDLAVLKIDKTGLTAAEFADSDQAAVGEFAMAVGSPLGLDTTVTTGIISAVNREVEADGTTYVCIQTDAAINSGNSGGALVNSDGQVIGINTLKLSGSGVEGIGFAIPINSTTDIIDDLIEYNKVLRPYIGITGIDLDENTVKRYKLATLGVYIRSVEHFSPAEKAGLQAGDIIIKADGQDLKTMDKLNEIKNTHQIGEIMTLTINRNGDEKEVTIALEEMP